MRKVISAALLCVSLGGCLTTGSPKHISAALPEIPADVRSCFTTLVSAPGAARLTNRDLVQLVADLRRSEYAKSECGKRLLNYYDTMTAGLK